MAQLQAIFTTGIMVKKEYESRSNSWINGVSFDLYELDWEGFDRTGKLRFINGTTTGR